MRIPLWASAEFAELKFRAATDNASKNEENG